MESIFQSVDKCQDFNQCLVAFEMCCFVVFQMKMNKCENSVII